MIHYNNNTWNNNGGADFHIPISLGNTSTGDKELGRKFSLWPVPADETVFVGVPVEFVGQHSLALFSSTGQQMLEQPIVSENFRLAISSLSAGFYMAAVLDKTGKQVALRKIAKKLLFAKLKGFE